MLLNYPGIKGRAGKSIRVSARVAERSEGSELAGHQVRTAFEHQVLVHLGAAFNLAQWLTHSRADAEDIVQEACIRAWNGFAGFRGENGKAWLLTIVRNASYTWLKHRRSGAGEKSFDEETDPQEERGDTPESILRQKRERIAVRRAVESLPVEFREVLILREWEGLSYKEISAISNIPMGTVMSRLIRARERLHKALADFPVGGK